MQQLLDCKPMLTIEGQIEHLKSKGITFNLVNEDDAREYLRNNNYYFKLTSYRKNYQKYEKGVNEGKYIALDFGHLKDLSIIDMELRYMLAQLSFDIEHYTKIELLRIAEDNNEDGYSICKDYINSLNEQHRELLLSEIERNRNTVYYGELVSTYSKELPLWVFLELISFGRLVSFYGFCSERYSSKLMENNYYMLMTCKDIRNAAAHNSCIINNLSPRTARFKLRIDVNQELCQIEGISKNVRNRKMSNARVQQIVTLLFIYKKIVTSKGVKDKAVRSLDLFVDRMLKNKSYYITNDVIRTTFDFLELVIDNWYLD